MDSANHTGGYVEPSRSTYRGHEIYECPPNGQGFTALLMFNILAGFDLAGLDPMDPKRLHLEAEVGRLADRLVHLRPVDDRPDHRDAVDGQRVLEPAVQHPVLARLEHARELDALLQRQVEETELLQQEFKKAQQLLQQEVQMLEDVICLVFLRWYFPGFANGRDPEQVFRIVAKTARKMSAEGRARVAAEFDLPEELARALEV